MVRHDKWKIIHLVICPLIKQLQQHHYVVYIYTIERFPSCHGHSVFDRGEQNRTEEIGNY